MNSKYYGKDNIINQLITCQQRVNELEKLGDPEKEVLDETRAIFESLFELSPDALILVDRQAHIVRMNTQAERLFGYTREELTGKNHGILVPERLREKHETDLKAYMAKPSVRVMGIGLELWGLRKDGTEFAADIDLGPLEIGQELFVLSVVRDATRRKQLENELLESEKRLRTTLDSMMEGCQIIDFSWRYAYVNDVVARQGRRKKEDLLGHTMMEIYPGIENTELFGHLRNCMENRVSHQMDNLFTFEDGPEGWFEIRLEPVPEGVFILSLDITERKRAEETLQKQTHDLGDRVKELNCLYSISNLAQKQGTSIEEILQTIVDIIPPSWQYPEVTCARIILNSQEFVTGNFRETAWKQNNDITASGVRIGSVEVYYLEEKPESDEGPFLKEERSLINAIAEQVGNITERKRAEEALQEIQERYRDFFDNAPIGFHMFGPNQIIADINQAELDMIGYSYDEIVGKKSWDDLIIPEQRQNFAKHWEEMSKSGEVKDLEYTLVRKDGRHVFVLLNASTRFDNEGKLINTRGSVLDITVRKKLEEELNRYRQRLEEVVAERTAEFAQANRELAQEMAEHKKADDGLMLRATILDNAREAIFLNNPNGDFVYVNEVACKTYGFSNDEFLRMNLRQLLPPQDAPLIGQQLEKVLEKRQLELEAVHVRKDQSLMPVQVRHNVIRTLHGEFIISVARDITTESKLRMLLEGTPGILLTTDTDLRLTSSMGAGLATMGLEADQGAGMTLSEYLEKNSIGNSVLEAHQRALAGASVSYEFENKELKRTYCGRAAPLHNDQGDLIGTISVMLEIH